MLSARKFHFRPLSREEGNVSILFGLAIPLLMALTALGVDSATINHQKDWMQNTADAVSLAVAKELHLYHDKTDALKSVGVDRAESLIAQSGYGGNENHVDVLVDDGARRVTVNLRMVAKPLLPADIWSENPMTVTSTALVYGSAKLCVLGLDPSKAKTIETKHGATLTSPECAIQSNSTDREGIAVTGGATIAGEKFKISSDSARKLIGTIYLPNANLEISGAGKVAQESAYTVILANTLKVDSANLVINADYAASDVPVPEGIGPNASVTRLER